MGTTGTWSKADGGTCRRCKRKAKFVLSISFGDGGGIETNYCPDHRALFDLAQEQNTTITELETGLKAKDLRELAVRARDAGRARRAGNVLKAAKIAAAKETA